MTTILAIYAVISVTFSLGFLAGAWWAARRPINERSLQLTTFDRNRARQF